ncbi:thiol reductant ABC exporter subunit CydC, partial [Rothia aeria]
TRALGALAARGANVLIVTHEGELAEHCALWLRADAHPGGGYRWALKTNPAPAPIPASAPPAQAHTLKTTTKAVLPSSPAELGTAPGVFATLKTLRGLTKIGVLKAVGPIMMAAATSLAAVALTALSGWLIVRAAEGPAMMYLMVAIVGVRFFGLGRATARYAERLLTHSRVLAAANTLRLRAWAGAYRNIGSVRALLRGDALLERLIGGIDELRDGIPRVILPPAAHMLVMAVALVSTWVILPQALGPVALAAFITTVLAPWVVLRADARAEGASRASTAQLMRLSTSLLGAAEDARANGVSQTAVAAAARVDARNLRALTRGAYAQGAGRALAVVAWFGVALWCAVIAYPLAVSGTVGAPESAIVVLMCTGMIESTVGHLEAVRSWPAFARLVARIAPDVAAEADIPDLTDDEEAANRAHSLVLAPASGRGPALELANAAARWPGMEAPVFEGLTVSARAGEWTGVTGPSGSGKSTVLASLLGFLPLESGQVRAHGQALDAERVRGYAAWCPQAAHIFESTLEGNLLLARDRSQRPTQQQMVAVLRRVGLGQWYDTLPEGLRTRVGAGGGFLSGGQRQRLAVARALLVESPVLLLDEPTAHLDAESAAALMADLDTATRAGGTATVLVSHRPEDIARCDMVVTLE